MEHPSVPSDIETSYAETNLIFHLLAPFASTRPSACGTEAHESSAARARISRASASAAGRARRAGCVDDAHERMVCSWLSTGCEQDTARATREESASSVPLMAERPFSPPSTFWITSPEGEGGRNEARVVSSAMLTTVVVVTSGSENRWSNDAEKLLKDEVSGLVGCNDDRNAPRARELDAQAFVIKHFNSGDLSRAVVDRKGRAVDV